MKEVIARRANTPIGIYSATLIAGLLLCVFGFGKWESMKGYGELYGLLGLACVIFSLVALFTVLKTPKEMIVYENGTLFFAGISCEPKEIQNVSYRQSRARRATYSHGTLTVYVRGEGRELRYVADVQAVHDKLISLMREQLQQGERNG